jgi:hypothetical protein
MSGVEGAERQDHDEREAGVSARRKKHVSSQIEQISFAKCARVLGEPLIERNRISTENALYFVGYG